MSDLSDVERDALQVARALAGLRHHLARRDGIEDDHVLQALAAEGGAAAVRVLAYLRELRGAGDGEATACPPRLGPWRDWYPARGNVLGRIGSGGSFGGAGGRVQRRRGGGDPGE